MHPTQHTHYITCTVCMFLHWCWLPALVLLLRVSPPMHTGPLEKPSSTLQPLQHILEVSKGFCTGGVLVCIVVFSMGTKWRGKCISTVYSKYILCILCTHVCAHTAYIIYTCVRTYYMVYCMWASNTQMVSTCALATALQKCLSCTVLLVLHT